MDLIFKYPMTRFNKYSTDKAERIIMKYMFMDNKFYSKTYLISTIFCE